MNPGERIRILRKQRSLTQEQLGNMLGVKKAAVQKYESGTVKNLKQDTIKKLSEIFNVDPTNFIECEPVANQVELIFQIKDNFGDKAVEILEGFTMLDEEGREKVEEYIKDMVKLHG